MSDSSHYFDINKEGAACKVFKALKSFPSYSKVIFKCSFRLFFLIKKKNIKLSNPHPASLPTLFLLIKKEQKAL
jgi:hypothetical protein